MNRIKSQTDYFTDPKNIKFDYGFDQLGRRLYEQRDGGTADGYKYDASDELTAFNRDGTVNATTGVVTGGISTMTTLYDGSGNRQTGTKDGVALSFGRNNLNQYTTTTTEGALGYDLKGNLTAIASQGWSYTYDAQNRLTALDNATTNVHIKQHYDPMNRITARDNNGAITSYVWDGWNLIEEHTGTAGTLSRAYLWGANQNELVEAFGGTLANMWYWQDGRGNTAAASGDLGHLVERYRYNWNGNVSFYDGNNVSRTASAATIDSRFLFAGSQYLPEASLYDMRNRFYHPTLSRFMQTDPVGLQVAGMKPSAIAAAFFPAGTAPEKFGSTELNLYRYCGNDFEDKTDPMGLLEFEIGGDESFQATVRADIGKIESKPFGAAAMKELRGSPFRNLIIPGKENLNTAHDGKASTNGQGSGSTTEYNPNLTQSTPDTSRKTTRPAYVGLAHELAGHGIEKTRGQHNPDTSSRNQPDKVPPPEKGAMKAENQIRQEHGLAPRRTHEYRE